MFYDLARPLEFARDVASVLADDGLWHLEQSYLPLMLETNAYDTICHEHTEYYALEQIDWIMRRVGLSILDVQLNDVNGGSFAVTVAKKDTRHPWPRESCCPPTGTRERPQSRHWPPVPRFHAAGRGSAQRVPRDARAAADRGSASIWVERLDQG